MTIDNLESFSEGLPEDGFNSSTREEGKEEFERLNVLLAAIVGELKKLTLNQRKSISRILGTNVAEDENRLNYMFTHWHEAARDWFAKKRRGSVAFVHREYGSRIRLRPSDLSLRSVQSASEEDLFIDIVVSQDKKYSDDKWLKIEKRVFELIENVDFFDSPSKCEEMIEIFRKAGTKGCIVSDFREIFPDVPEELLARRVASKISQLNRSHFAKKNLMINSTVTYHLEFISELEVASV